MLLAGLFVTITALTGDGDFSKGGYKTFLMAGITFWGIISCVLSIRNLDKNITKTNENSFKNEQRADILLFISSLFYFTAIWFIIPFKEMASDWSEMTIGNQVEYVVGGLLLYLMVHIPTNYFFYYDRLMSYDSRYKMMIYWLLVLFIGLVVIFIPVIY